MARTVTVFGGSGFIGRYVVERLAARGDRVRVAVRRPNQALFLKPYGAVGQISLMATNIRDEASVAAAIEGADAVVNLVGILAPSGAQTFKAVQQEGAKRVARLAKAAGIERFVQMSAIGADSGSTAQYAKTKGLAEEAVMKEIPTATLLRPSIVVGHEDQFFNQFAQMMKTLPGPLPLPGVNTRFQPVYVGDVADAVVTALEGGQLVEGQVFELGGPEVDTFKGLLERLMDVIKVKKAILSLPWAVAFIQGFIFQMLPGKLITVDQVKMLKRDNIVSEDAKTLADLGIKPTPLSAVLPRYATQYLPQGQFSE